MWTSTPCSANCSRAAARIRLRLRRASARCFCATGGAAGGFEVVVGGMSISSLSDRRLGGCLCDELHANGIEIPYTARSETGIHVPIIGRSEGQDPERHKEDR